MSGGLFQKVMRRSALSLGGVALGFGIFHKAERGRLLLSAQEWDSNWDKCEPEFLVKPLKSDVCDEKKIAERAEKVRNSVSKSRRILIFIRHGQYNLEGLTDSENYLTELGMEQAALTGRKLKELLKHYGGPDTPISLTMSSMKRASQTAEIILKDLDPKIAESAKTCHLLREGSPIVPSPPAKNWDPRPVDFYTDGIRIEAGFRKYFYRADPTAEKDSIEIFVCHANVIRYFVCRALQLPPEAWLRMSLHNGSFTVFTIFPCGNVSLSTLGNYGHFPKEKMTLN